MTKNEYDFCPNCKIDLRGEPIPEKYKEFYEESVTHYSRLIGVYDLKQDRVVLWKCPDCNYQWDRK